MMGLDKRKSKICALDDFLGETRDALEDFLKLVDNSRNDSIYSEALKHAA
jgi:hypothetical protein